MDRSPLVNVEGELARPRLMPLDGIPFGHEWTFLGTRDAPIGECRLAGIKTSCIDVNTPHRTCHWWPLNGTAQGPAASPSRAELPAAAPSSASRLRLATAAACWSVSALSIIGWLIVAHTPRSNSLALSKATQSGTVTPQPATQPRAATLARATAQAERHRTITQPANAQMAVDVSNPSVEAPSRGPARNMQRLAATSPPQSHASDRRSVAAAAHDDSPALQRVATRTQPARHPASASSQNVYANAAPAPVPAPDSLDDPRTLIALANTLRAERPPVVGDAPVAPGFDWTANLTHRRLTDAPDTFAH
ncbi:hypothetical protein [Burkholderia sp. BCC0322]|uniref:hypothetical protein n=1 Tax=Burkholderia sp. BCC0322 TaxID=2676296 RepID=UPI00158D4C9D|nr:hypothetical protein [Burkholderia sp. BCC0322]